MNSRLIYDIGMHKGEDTAYYLKRGYDVVAVEANPILADFCRKKFQKEISANRLRILNVGISESSGIMPFYVNHYSSEWSSFDKNIGTRNNTPHEVIDVQCKTTAQLFQEYGVPFYMKVDIEGLDFLAIKDIPATGPKPQFVSCEASELEWLDLLKQKGYTKFKLINQANNFRPLKVSLEKKKTYVLFRKTKHAFKHKLRKVLPVKYAGGSSGPFGMESKGDWKPFEEIRADYIEYMGENCKNPVNHISWCDFHATV